MEQFFRFYRLLIQHSLANWKLLAIGGIGVLVAAVLLASAPIYTRSMADLGLTYSVRDQLRNDPVIKTGFFAGAIADKEGLERVSVIEERITTHLGWFTKNQEKLYEAPFLTIGFTGDEPRILSLLAAPLAITGVSPHLNVLEGELPQKREDLVLEVVISELTSYITQLKPGETFFLIEEFDNCPRIVTTGLEPQPPCMKSSMMRYSIPAIVSGIIEITDPEHPFWLGASERFVRPRSPFVDSGTVVPLLADPDALIQVLKAYTASYEFSVTWQNFANLEALNRTNFQDVSTSINVLNEEMRSFDGYSASNLTEALNNYDLSANFQQAPLTILLLQIAAIALFYVAIISVAIVERQADVIGLLRARGASVVQIGLLYTLSGLLVALPAAVVAPFIAAAGTALLGLTPVFANVSNGDLLPVNIESIAFPFALAGACLAVIVLIVPAVLTARRGALGQARLHSRPRQSLLLRYYLDIVLVLFALLALWELGERDSVFIPSATGAMSTDPLLLASPAIVIVAVAAVVARFYPFVVRVLMGLLSKFSSESVYMGLRQFVRNPGPYVQLALLLMMAVAVGTFAASYASTAEKSYKDRAKFESGLAIRALTNTTYGAESSADLLQERVNKIDGVERSVAAMRRSTKIASVSGVGSEVNLLAVNPATSNMLWWREDFSKLPLERLLSRLDTGHLLPGVEIPPSAIGLSIQVNPEQVFQDKTLWARIRGENNRHSVIEFGKLDFSGWRELRADLPREGPGRIKGPFTFVALLVSEPPNQFNQSESPVLWLDDLAFIGSEGDLDVFESFEGTVIWEAAASEGDFNDSIKLTESAKISGLRGAEINFREGISGERHAFFIADRNVPLPVLVSQSFLGTTGLRVGDKGLISFEDLSVPYVIREVYERFPTLMQGDGPSIVFNIEHLLAWANALRGSAATVGSVNEIWIEVSSEANHEIISSALIASGLGQVIDQTQLLSSIEKNPLIAASGSGILVISFAAILVLVAAALMVSLFMSIRRRRVEFAVLRAIGLRRQQIVVALFVEYMLVAFVGIVVGAVSGLILGNQMLSFLEFTETGTRVEPPFILQTDWIMVGIGVGVILLVFVLALVAARGFLARNSDSTALRTE